jgi:hypothetical protein
MSFDRCQPSLVRAISVLDCLYRKASLPFSHTPVGAYLRYRSASQPCSRSQSFHVWKMPAGSLTQGKKGTPALGCAADSSKYFWTFHLPCAAWSLMYSTRIYHVGLDYWPLILNMDSCSSIWTRCGCVDHRESETVECAGESTERRDEMETTE